MKINSKIKKRVVSKMVEFLARVESATRNEIVDNEEWLVNFVGSVYAFIYVIIFFL